MTLEETKEQVAQSEQRLSQLKEDKHQLYRLFTFILHFDNFVISKKCLLILSGSCS